MNSDAQKQWEFENKIKKLSNDEFFEIDAKQEEALREIAPWKSSPTYFKKVKISAIALLKMVMHTQRAAVSPLAMTEVMGLLQGTVIGDSFIILDSFPLPVEGTETRVSAGDEAAEFINKYTTAQATMGKKENVVGWYHSHPGFGCWMSGIDCETQKNNQKFTDPFVALVIDPIKTVSAGKVEIGAFRTYPEGHKATKEQVKSQSGIPSQKIKDFGKYWNAYYQLPIEYFKSSSDTNLLSLLWKKYWVKTLSSSPLVKNKFYTDNQMKDLSSKFDETEQEISKTFRSMFTPAESLLGEGGKIEKKETSFGHLNEDSAKLSQEVIRGTITQLVKDIGWNRKLI